MNTIWVTGSKGQLGTEIFLQKEKLKSCRFLFTDIEELDLTNENAVLDYAQKEKPGIIINCAGYTAVDKAEKEQEQAFLLNCFVPAYLSKAAKLSKGTLIHISSDYVFDGRANRPYREDDNPNPQSVYGKSKLAGEKEVLKNERNLVIRTSWLYSMHGNNFVKTMLLLGKEKDEISVVSDQVGSPASAVDLAHTILQICRKLFDTNENYGGIYHYSNEGSCSWYEFASAIMETAGLNCTVHPITSDKYPRPAKRPAYSIMSREKIKRTFNISINHWKDSLSEYFNKIT
ncbi:MAG: dTDP-4-dehydrorhamnose reductase [Bacteroidales bacterium]|nr:dTDP-4-dehydrorhamnose reductase [Bacteroidales bacterium]